MYDYLRAQNSPGPDAGSGQGTPRGGGPHGGPIPQPEKFSQLVSPITNS